MGGSVAFATIFIVGAVLAIKKACRPAQGRQVPNVPEPNVAPVQQANERTTDLVMVSKSKVPNEAAIVPNDVVVGF